MTGYLILYLIAICPQLMPAQCYQLPDFANLKQAIGKEGLLTDKVISTLLGSAKHIDLSHPMSNATLHWPTNSGFERVEVSNHSYKVPSGVEQFTFSDGFKTAGHVGTHLDAPRHFSPEAQSLDQIPLERLTFVLATVIDLSAKVAANRTYSFTKADFLNHAPKPAQGSVVLIYTGISDLWDFGQEKYFGTSGTNYTEMKFPGFSEEAAQYLAEEVKVYGVGVDSPSADSSARHFNSTEADLVAHRIFGRNNIYMLENIHKRLKDLVGVKPIILTVNPLPIVGASGTPVRLVATVPSPEKLEATLKDVTSIMQGFTNGAGIVTSTPTITGIIMICISLSIITSLVNSIPRA